MNKYNNDNGTQDLTVKRAERFSKIFASISIVIGALVLLGWTFNLQLLKSILPVFVSMKANTAIGFVLLGFSLILNQDKKNARLFSRIFTVFVLLLGLLTLSQYLFNINLRIDQLIFLDNSSSNPGRMALTTAIIFILLSSALILFQSRLGYQIAQAITLFAAASGFVSSIGYAYSVSPLFQFHTYPAIALHTAFLFVLLSFGILFSKPQLGLMKILLSRNVGGVMVRKILPFAILFPFLTGWIHVNSQYIELLPLGAAEIILDIIYVGLFSILIIWLANSLNTVDIERIRGEEELIKQNAALTAVMNNSHSVMIFLLDKNYRYVAFNNNHKREMKKVYGADIELGMNLLDLITIPEVNEKTKVSIDRVLNGETFIETGIQPELNLYYEFHWNTVRREGEVIGASCFIIDITERKLAEESLIKSEEKYREIFENVQDVFYQVKLDGIVSEISPSIEHITDFSREELIGRQITDFYYNPSDRSTLIKNIQEKGELKDYELKMKTKTGGIRNVSINARLILDMNGQPDHIDGAMRDITVRKIAEEALIESEKKYRQLIENAAELILLTDKNGNFIFANDAALKFSGYTLQEITSFNYLDLVHEDYKKKVSTFYYRQFINKNEESSLQFPFYTKSGEIKWLEQNVKLNMDGGKLTGYQLIARDITERIILEDSLRENLIRMSGIIEGTPHLFFYTQDSDGNSTYASPTIEKITGYSINSWLAAKDWFATDSAINKIAKERTHTHLRGELIKDPILVEIKHAAGHTIFLEVYENPIFRDGKVIGLQGVAHDITERKKSEAALIDSERKFKDMAELLPQTIFETDENGTLTYTNEVSFKLFGYSKEDFSQKLTALEMIDPKERSIAAENILRVMRGEETTTHEYTALRKNGTTFPVLIFSSPIIKNGKVLGLRGTIIDITERKRAEEALRDSEERIKFINNNLVTSMIYQLVIDKQGARRFTYLSDNVQLLHGITLQEVMSDAGLLYNQILVSDRARFDREEELAIKTLSKFETEVRIVNRKGEERWVQLVSHPTKMPDGSISFSGIESDITERKNSEEQILLLSRAVENSPVTIMITNEEGKIEYVNRKFIELTGYALEEVKGKKPSILKSGDKSDEDYNILWKTIKSGKEWRGEFHNRKKNGDLYWESATIVPIKNDRIFFLALKEDITERKRSEEKILLLANAIESVRECVTITDHENKILFTNNAFRETYGYSEQELIGKDISLVRSQSVANKTTYDILPRTKDGGWYGEVMNRKKDGTDFPVYLSSAPIRDENGKQIALIGVASDITQEIIAREELIKAKEHAEQSDKLKSEFLAQMSHEVRTPLNILLSFSTYIKEILEERQHLTEDLDEYFSATSNAGKRIIRTIELILNMSDLKSGGFVNVPKPTDIYNDILKDVFHQFIGSVNENKVKFDLVQKSDSLFANVDQYSTEQLLIHIIDNAIKFTEKGHVCIYAEKNHHGNSVVRIEDTGIGMTKEYLKRLFTVFSQEDQSYSRAYDGNGLGLALVKKYCELNNIQIDVQSEKGMGTIFTLTFPK